MRSSCGYGVETCKTGQVSQMKLLDLAFRFGFLAVGLPSIFVDLWGFRKNYKVRNTLFLENVESFIFLFFFHNLEKSKTSLSSYMQEQIGGQEVVNASKYLYLCLHLHGF